MTETIVWVGEFRDDLQQACGLVEVVRDKFHHRLLDPDKEFFLNDLHEEDGEDDVWDPVSPCFDAEDVPGNLQSLLKEFFFPKLYKKYYKDLQF